MPNAKIVIYCRFSTDMQRAESCEDQEREVRQGLVRKGIDPANAIVIFDLAESGTKMDREKFQQLCGMIESKEIAVLAVDDQSRISRGDNAMQFIADLVFSGGRFISTTENIDTNESGWELKVKVNEIQHSMFIRGLADKVRRGQRGRVLDDDSAGDLPYGYESFFHDANWLEQLARRGPKPKKGIQMHEVEAVWVRKIFKWFVDGMSIQKIAKQLTQEGAPKGNRATTQGWHPQQVRRILGNPKYIGRWRWGQKKTIRNSRGRARQVPVEEGAVVERQRDNLRIIEQDVWNRAQSRLREFEDQYGWKTEQKKRGPKVSSNPTSQNPRSVLGGVLRCAACGSVMWYKGSGGRRYYSCSANASNRCDQSFQVPAEKAEQAVIAAITRRVEEWPDWIREIQSQLEAILVEAARQIPVEREHDERRIVALKKQHTNLIDLAAQGGSSSSGIVERIKSLEREIAELEQRRSDRPMPSEKEIQVPSEKWIRDQIENWSLALTNEQRVAKAIREALVRIDARAIVAPGKKRGYPELTLHFRSWELFRAMVDAKLPQSIRQLMPQSVALPDSSTEVIALGSPTEMDQWAPKIVQWRKEGVIWEEIVRRTGMDLNRVFVAWKRFINDPRFTEQSGTRYGYADHSPGEQLSEE